MHGNLSVGHAEEENNFSDVSEIIDVHSIIVPCRGRASEQKRKKKRNLHTHETLRRLYNIGKESNFIQLFLQTMWNYKMKNGHYKSKQ